MSLKEFQSKFSSVDIQRPNRYRVAITGPFGSDETVDMLCENAQFPGQNMRTSTDDLRHGPVREIIHGTTYGPITLTFICTTGMPEKKWFENWQTYMVERRNKIMWQAKYYNQYIGEISMYSLNRVDGDAYKIKIFEAFPKTITQQEFSYGSQNDYQRVSVEFAYHHWVSETIGVAGAKGGRPRTSIQPTIPWVNPNGSPSPDMPSRAADRHPPAIDEFGINTTPAVPNPADQQFYPSSAQPVAQSPNNNGLDADTNNGVGDGRP